MSSRPLLLDAFCGAGGAAVGYHRAGFDVIGVDNRPQPRYPFQFILGDALDYISRSCREYDAIHASPPCGDYSVMKHATSNPHPRLIAPARALLQRTGRPYVIENVELALPELHSPVTLCGTMFGLRVRRHRLFEISPLMLLMTPPCHCRNGVRDGRLIGQMLSGKVAPGRTPRNGYTESDRREAIGVPWMTTMEARQAIPPTYTEFIGRQLLALASPAGSRAPDTAPNSKPGTDYQPAPARHTAGTLAAPDSPNVLAQDCELLPSARPSAAHLDNLYHGEAGLVEWAAVQTLNLEPPRAIGLAELQTDRLSLAAGQVVLDDDRLLVHVPAPCRSYGCSIAHDYIGVKGQSGGVS